MTDTFTELDNKEIFPTFEISDDALETAAANEMFIQYTLGACSGLSVCPG